MNEVKSPTTRKSGTLPSSKSPTASPIHKNNVSSNSIGTPTRQPKGDQQVYL